MSAQTSASDSSMPRQSRLSWWLHAAGYAVGLGLLAWCIQFALGQGDWSKVRAASPGLVASLVIASIVSILINGLLFRLTLETVLPVIDREGKPRRVVLPTLAAISWVNWVCTLANFTPMRLGMIARVTYHMRVDRLRWMEIVNWFGLELLTFLIPIGGALGATLLLRSFGLAWVVLAIGLTAVGGVAVWWIASFPIVRRIGGESARIGGDGHALLICLPIRLVDLASNGVRTWCAAQMLGLDLNLADATALACAGLLASLGPLGRLGFREAGFAVVAQLLAKGGFDGGVDAAFVQLSIIDSAGEVIAAMIGGIPLSFWMTRRIVNARATAQTVSG